MFVRLRLHCGVYVEIEYWFVVCVRARAYVRECVLTYVSVRICVCVCMRAPRTCERGCAKAFGQ